MKKIILLSFIVLLSTQLTAQIPKGDRILAWQIDLAQNSNYDSSFAYAQKACMESAHLFFTWSQLEPNQGNFDSAFISSTLDIVDFYFPYKNTSIELQIATINTVAKETPADLFNISFSDTAMISRFKTTLDTIFAHIPNVEITALNIGNESDIFFGTDSLQYIAYKTFLDSVVPYAKQIYFNLHGKDLKIGTTLTHDGLTSPNQSNLCKVLNDSLDIVSVTYYPLNSDFTMQSPSVVFTDFNSIVNYYPDTLQPIYFVECGYASSAICNSSETLQSQFFHNVFTAWDTHKSNIKYLSIFKTTDWSQATVDDLGQYYGITDTIFLEYLRTLGVRTWDNDGTNKIAYETIRCELHARNWCQVNCNSVSIEEPENLNSVSIYPNPTYGRITINTADKVSSVQLFNMEGKLLFSTTETTFEIESIAKGLYLIIIQLESGEIYRSKLIKE